MNQTHTPKKLAGWAAVWETSRTPASTPADRLIAGWAVVGVFTDSEAKQRAYDMVYHLAHEFAENNGKQAVQLTGPEGFVSWTVVVGRVVSRWVAQPVFSR
jgi:hypothetical protein